MAMRINLPGDTGTAKCTVAWLLMVLSLLSPKLTFYVAAKTMSLLRTRSVQFSSQVVGFLLSN